MKQVDDGGDAQVEQNDAAAQTDYAARFDGIRRLYGREGADIIRSMAVCVVGIGGVGSWTVEALARSGVGRIRMIDHDDIAISNINRQLHTLDSTIGRSKVAVMAERVTAIHPGCHCEPVDDLLTTANLERHLEDGFDVVVDAIDTIRFKAALIHFCRRRKLPVVTTGGAGGLTDPAAVTVADLSRTTNDPLAARVRSKLRADHHFPKNPKRRFGVDCVYSTEQPVYPRADGSVSHRKPGVHGATLDCATGYGSATAVTAVFGMVAAGRAIERTLRRRRA